MKVLLRIDEYTMWLLPDIAWPATNPAAQKHMITDIPRAYGNTLLYALIISFYANIPDVIVLCSETLQL